MLIKYVLHILPIVPIQLLLAIVKQYLLTYFKCRGNWFYLFFNILLVNKMIQ